jgi:hypothetical protein
MPVSLSLPLREDAYKGEPGQPPAENRRRTRIFFWGWGAGREGEPADVEFF